jgi:polyisoprenoid-binding protein YceI
MSKQKLFGLIAGALLGVSHPLLAASSRYEVKAAESTVNWTGRKVVGNSHTGTIAVKGGQVVFDDKGPQSGEFVIDMATIKNLDLTDAKDNQKLTGHLNSADFFDTAVHKTAMFKIKSVTSAPGGKFEAIGDLTIKGKTSPATITGLMAIAGDKLTADGAFKFDRTLYDVRYGSGKFFENLGDKMISDEIAIAIKLVAYKTENKKS